MTNREARDNLLMCMSDYSEHWDEKSKETIKKAIEALDNDVVPVIRCKDCKYAREPDRENRYESKACECVLICSAHETVLPGDCGLVFVDEEHFCAYGVRKEGG